VKASQ